jgi:hypothetical protein
MLRRALGGMFRSPWGVGCVDKASGAAWASFGVQLLIITSRSFDLPGLHVSTSLGFGCLDMTWAVKVLKRVRGGSPRSTEPASKKNSGASGRVGKGGEKGTGYFRPSSYMSQVIDAHPTQTGTCAARTRGCVCTGRLAGADGVGDAGCRSQGRRRQSFGRSAAGRAWPMRLRERIGGKPYLFSCVRLQ